jgi:DNA-binding transcriptional LysR family regulator
LLAGVIDLGYSLLPAEHPEITSQVLIDDQLVLVVASNHPLANTKALTFEDIRDLQFALPSSRVSSARGLLEYFERHSVQPNVVLEYDDGHALVKIVRSRNLVTCLPRFSIDDLQDLKYLPLPAEGQKIRAGALWMYLSPAAKAFLEIATELYKSESVKT